MSITKAEKAALAKKNLAKANTVKASKKAQPTIPPDEHDDEGLGLEDVPAEPVPDFVGDEPADAVTHSEPAPGVPRPSRELAIRDALVRIYNSPLGCVCGTMPTDQRTEHIIDTQILHHKDCAYVIAQQALAAAAE